MKNWLRILLIVLSGCGIGFINGFLGGGGGVLVVAVFLALYALPQKKRPRYRASRNSSDKLNQRAGLSAKRQR